MKKILTTIAIALTATGLQAQTVLQFDLDEANGTQMTGLSPSVGTGSWAQDITGVATNGSGSLVSADSASTASNLDIADLSSGIYEFSTSGVTFANVGGGSDDFVGLGFRTFSSTSGIGDSGADLVALKVGNINSSGTMDAVLRINGADDQTVNDFSSFSGTFEFIARYDLDANEASFFYDSGSGRNQIGTTVSSVTANATYIGYSLATVDFGGGDTITAGNIALTAIPEPSSALLIGLGGAALVFLRRRR